MSIYERALHFNPANEDLLLPYLSTCRLTARALLSSYVRRFRAIFSASFQLLAQVSTTPLSKTHNRILHVAPATLLNESFGAGSQASATALYEDIQSLVSLLVCPLGRTGARAVDH